MADDSNDSDWPKLIPTSGSRLGGVHKDKKQRITEAMYDLKLAMAGLAMRGEGEQPYLELIRGQSVSGTGGINVSQKAGS